MGEVIKLGFVDTIAMDDESISAIFNDNAGKVEDFLVRSGFKIGKPMFFRVGHIVESKPVFVDDNVVEMVDVLQLFHSRMMDGDHDLQLFVCQRRKRW